MTRQSLLVSTIVLLAGATMLVTAPARAAETFVATIAANAQTIKFTHGMAWIDSKGKVSFGLYKTDPNPAEQARALKDGGAIFGVFEAPNVTFDLRFKEGATRADLASFESCHINFSHFDAGVGIFDWNAFAKGCGPVAFSGDLKPGSVVHAKLKGQAEGFPNKDGSKNVYTWDVDVTATVRAKP
jgi:hypothetical protein